MSCKKCDTACEPKLHSVILNGEVDSETLKHYGEKGWVFLYAAPANKFHPYACDTDTILFMAKPIDKEAYDKEMQEFYDSHAVAESAE